MPYQLRSSVSFYRLVLFSSRGKPAPLTYISVLFSLIKTDMATDARQWYVFFVICQWFETGFVRRTWSLSVRTNGFSPSFQRIIPNHTCTIPAVYLSARIHVCAACTTDNLTIKKSSSAKLKAAFPPPFPLIIISAALLPPPLRRRELTMNRVCLIVIHRMYSVQPRILSKEQTDHQRSMIRTISKRRS